MSKPVGYGNPPAHTRWTKGQSGNPKGRMKGQKNLKTDLKAELAETLHLSEGGRPVTLSRQRVLLKSVLARAINNDNRAAELIFKLMGQLLEDEPDLEAEPPLSANDQVLLDTYLALHGVKKGDA